MLLPLIKARHLHLVGLVLLVLVVVAVYLPALRGGFVWDDDSYLTENGNLQSLAGLKRIWFEPRSSPQYYPLVFSTFWVENQLWRLQPLGYHLVNVLLHAANAILLWYILSRLSLPGAWLAATIFALHPVHVESVAWITERKNVLSAAFYFGSAISYLHFAGITDREVSSPHRRRWGAYGLALALFMLALLTKTVTSSLPAAILLVIWWKRDRLAWSDVAPLAPMMAAGALLGFHTSYLEKHHVGAQGAEWDFTFFEHCLIAGRTLWFYAGKLLWPYPLIFSYPRWQIDTTLAWQYVFPISAFAAISLLFVLRRQMGRGPVAGTLFFAITLFPVSGFFAFYPMRFSFVADHFQYIASCGVIALFSAMLARLASKCASPRGDQALLSIALCLAILLGTLTRNQSRIYADHETLWQDTLAKNPESYLAHNILGIMRDKQGSYAEARDHFEKSLRIKPDFAETHFALGATYDHGGDLTRAKTKYEDALRIMPSHSMAHNNLGIINYKRGDLAAARRNFEVALHVQPDYAKAHFNLGAVLETQKMYAEAADHYRETLRLEPDHAQAAVRLKDVLAQRSRVPEAVH